MKFFLPILFFCFLYASQAQPVITSQSFPQVGDTLFTHVDHLPNNINTVAKGEGKRWDFSALQSPFARQMDIFPADVFSEFQHFPQANAAVILKENQLGFYHIGDSEITLLGLVGDDPLALGLNTVVRYEPPLVDRRAPLRYQDGFQTESNVVYSFALEELPRNHFSLLPFTPDSLRISINIDRQDYVDAWGRLIIPGGIFDVLRERRQEVRNVRLEARIGRQPWQEVTDLMEGTDWMGSQSTVTYFYHSNQAVNPVAEVYMDGYEKKLLSVIYKARSSAENIQLVGALKSGVYAYPNPAIVNVRFEFTNLPAGNYKLAIFNILGLEEWSKTYYIDGNRTEKVNIAGLRKGSYLYSLVDEKGKTIGTKRLIVIKP